MARDASPLWQIVKTIKTGRGSRRKERPQSEPEGYRFRNSEGRDCAMKLSLLSVLSDEEIGQIHEASLEILERCGLKIGSREMLSFLAGKGLPVDGEIVRFPRSCVEDAMATVPPRFAVFDREGRFAFELGDGTSRIAAGHNAIFWVDSDTGKTRPSTVADVAHFTRICEDLPAIDMIGLPVMPQDVPNPGASLLYGVKAVIENSRKPIYFSSDRLEINHAAMRMARAAFAGDFASQVYGISQLSPTSPLTWEGSVLDALQDTIEMGVPLAVLPEPNAGVSAPYTLAGLLTVNNAECLSGLVIAQLLRPGAKLLYANSWTAMDMRNGAALVGSTETTVCRIAGAQLARFYRVPSHTTAPNSDNHTHDEQNAWEKTLSTFCSVAAGNDLVVNCGMFATGMTCSHEQLIMDEEISAMSRRIVAGIRVEEDSIAKDLIMEIGPGSGGYLTSDHTLRWLRTDEYLLPRVSVRGPRASWEAEGAKDTYRLAREKAKAYPARPRFPLDARRQAKLEDILGSFE
ncbi:MAG: trimethylamine methyltransferase family protein [Armatimonadetes bacterium]|nr:trimethylamine methyltransferase family protein [Armatimonadota bacterium]